MDWIWGEVAPGNKRDVDDFMRSNPSVHDMNGIWWTLIRLLVYIKHEVAEYWIVKM